MSFLIHLDKANMTESRQTDKDGKVKYWASLGVPGGSVLKVMSEDIDLTKLPELEPMTVDLQITPLQWGSSQQLRVDNITVKLLYPQAGNGSKPAGS